MRTFMCYTCNGDFSQGYWLDTGESEEIFYCDECAKAARITDSEHARRHLPYTGYEIRTGFLAGNLFSDSSDDGGTYDVDASAARYAEMCREALEREFPGADVTVDCELNAEGATPATLQTHVWEADGEAPDNNDRIAEHVDDICQRVWESWEWVVYEDVEAHA